MYQYTLPKFKQGDRVMVLHGPRLAELGTFSHYDRQGFCWVEFKDGEKIDYGEHQLKHYIR